MRHPVERRGVFLSKNIDNHILYVIKENETLEDVSTKFNIDLEEIKNMNREIEYKKGNLINIPIHD